MRITHVEFKMHGLVFLVVLLSSRSVISQTQNKRMVCSMVEDKDDPVNLQETGEKVKVMPFSISSPTGLLQSILPFLKNLPLVESSEELPPTRINTGSQNISLSCDIVSSSVKAQISNLEKEVAKLRERVLKIEGKDACPGGFTYLNRCFRLMEIRGKKFPYHKAEDLCNYNGGVLAKLDSDLVVSRVMVHVVQKLLNDNYKDQLLLKVWLGMKYQLPASATATPGPFPIPTFASSTSSNSQRANRESRFLMWYPTFPTKTGGYNRIALQFRFNKAHNRTLFAGAVNIPKRGHQGIPLCEFYMNNWNDEDSVSAKLFEFRPF